MVHKEIKMSEGSDSTKTMKKQSNWAPELNLHCQLSVENPIPQSRPPIEPKEGEQQKP
jgi:hypothetical protein